MLFSKPNKLYTLIKCFFKEKQLVPRVLWKLRELGNFPKNDTHNIKEDLANINSIQQVTYMVLKRKVYQTFTSRTSGGKC